MDMQGKIVVWTLGGMLKVGSLLFVIKLGVGIAEGIDKKLKILDDKLSLPNILELAKSLWKGFGF